MAAAICSAVAPGGSADTRCPSRDTCHPARPDVCATCSIAALSADVGAADAAAARLCAWIASCSAFIAPAAARAAAASSSNCLRRCAYISPAWDSGALPAPPPVGLFL